jgi:hypothetical protein
VTFLVIAFYMDDLKWDSVKFRIMFEKIKSANSILCAFNFM